MTTRAEGLRTQLAYFDRENQYLTAERERLSSERDILKGQLKVWTDRFANDTAALIAERDRLRAALVHMLDCWDSACDPAKPQKVCDFGQIRKLVASSAGCQPPTST